MADSPLFSIVMVTLNCADTAIYTSQSVFTQTWHGYELVVKDGCSTDSTIDRLKEKKHPSTKIIVSPDTGIYDAMNQSLVYCSGEYVCFLNAGDKFSDDTILEKIAFIARKSNYPDFIFGDIVSYEGISAVSSKGRHITYRDKLSRFYLFRKMICHQAWFVKRKLLLDHGGFSNRYKLAADYDVLLYLFCDKRVSYVHAPFTIVDYAGNGQSSRQIDLVRKEMRTIHKHYFSKIERLLFSFLYFPYQQLALRGKKFRKQGVKKNL